MAVSAHAQEQYV